MVTVLEETEDLTVAGDGSVEKVTCICGGSSESIQFSILPLNLGTHKI